MDLNRRRFLGLAGAGAGAVAAGALGWELLLRDHLEEATTGAPPGTVPGPDGAVPGTTTPPPGVGRILVVLQLAGGNDGLNTLVPAGDGRYHDLRPTLGVADAELVALDGETHYGLHPALVPLAPLWAAGRMAAVESIGLRNQSRSHFVAQDHWWAASDDDHETTGWIGRWLDATGDGSNPLRAIALGARSPALTAERSTSTVVLDPTQFRVRAPKGADAARLTEAFRATAAPLASDDLLAAAQGAIPDALAAVDLLAAVNGSAAGGAGGTGGARGTANRRQQGPESMTDLLATAAGIIDHDIGTQVLVIGGDGFDTHADQATRHPKLLEDLATGVTTFLAEMERQGRADQVLVLTTSEFGRRAAENGSGTDHGYGGVQFLFGAGLAASQVVGQADLANLVDGDLDVATDTRSLYANALDWLGGPTDEVLGGTFDRHALLTP